MERLNLKKKEKNGMLYSRETAKRALENVLNKINEVNENNEIIYRITKAVLFGSYINSNKEKIGDLDIALYVELKNKDIPEVNQNIKRSYNANYYIPYIYRMIYGKDEVFKIIKDKKKILQLHDGYLVDAEAERYGEDISYIFFDKNRVIFEEVK